MDDGSPATKTWMFFCGHQVENVGRRGLVVAQCAPARHPFFATFFGCAKKVDFKRKNNDKPNQRDEPPS